MLIKLIADFGGRETGERHYPPGSVLEVDEALGQRLIKDHRAELLPEAPEVKPIIVPAVPHALASPTERSRKHGRTR